MDKLKCCILFFFTAGPNNANANSYNITFTIKDTRLYLRVLTLSAEDNQKPSKIFSKGFDRSVYWKEYKTKSENKYMTNEYRYFLESNVAGVNRLFALVYTNQVVISKRFKTTTLSSIEKTFMTKQLIKM